MQKHALRLEIHLQSCPNRNQFWTMATWALLPDLGVQSENLDPSLPLLPYLWNKAKQKSSRWGLEKESQLELKAGMPVWDPAPDETQSLLLL